MINQINDIQNTIASAVEEQSATTNEISRNLAEAAKGGMDITSLEWRRQRTARRPGPAKRKSRQEYGEYGRGVHKSWYRNSRKYKGTNGRAPRAAASAD